MALASVLGGAIAALSGQSAQAQSAYGCRNLVTSNALPSVEGERGFFFRIDPNMLSHLAMADRTIDQVAELSVRLREQGTELIYVPIPTKAQIVPQDLPPLARHLGYDVALSATVYDETLKHLTRAGVRSVDARHVLRKAGETGPAPIHGTDPRLNATGTQTLAQAIARAVADAPGYELLPKMGFRNTVTEIAPLPSLMALQLQDHCSATLPALTARQFTIQPPLTTAEDALFPGGLPAERIALAGSEFVSDGSANFAGFLAAATGLNVENHTVPGDSGLLALSDLVASQAFQEVRPAYLVWLHPVWQSLARFGDVPMRGLQAAARQDCSVALPTQPGTDPNSHTADLGSLSDPAALTLFMDTTTPEARIARFHFAGPDGLIRSRAIYRAPGQKDSGRFYMPMAGLWPEGATSVRITLDVPFGPAPRLSACR